MSVSVDDPDVRSLRREYAFEAIDGAIVQFSAAGRFLARGEDRYAAAAFQRGIEFVKLASPEVRAFVGAETPAARGQEAA